TQRSHDFTALKAPWPMRKSLQRSSSKGSPPLKTMFGLNRFILTGVSSRRFNSSSDDCPIVRTGYASARLTWFPFLSYLESTGRGLFSGKKTSLQFIPTCFENQPER